MSSVWIKINQIRKNKFVRLGIPFFVLVLGGSFYLEQFSKLRYKYGTQVNTLDHEQLKKEGLQLAERNEITLEAQYEKIKDLDIDNWEQIRGPRPWENN